MVATIFCLPKYSSGPGIIYGEHSWLVVSILYDCWAAWITSFGYYGPRSSLESLGALVASATKASIFLDLLHIIIYPGGWAEQEVCFG